MRQIVVRLSVGDAFQAEADEVKWVTAHSPNQMILRVFLSDKVIAEFLQHGVIGWWWQDGPVVVGK